MFLVKYIFHFSFIATSDRDEKIRVTNYPATHEIEAYCVGHKEYISSISFFDNERLLLSASGDKTIRLWNFKNGKEVQKISLDYVPVIAVISEDFNLMAITGDDNTAYLYSYKVVSPDITKLQLLGQKTFANDYDLGFAGGNFYFKYAEDHDGKKRIIVEKATIDDGAVAFEVFADINKAFALTLDTDFKLYKPFDVSLLYKKRFDGCKQYIDRKKERIENQASKKPRQK